MACHAVAGARSEVKEARRSQGKQGKKREPGNPVKTDGSSTVFHPQPSHQHQLCYYSDLSLRSGASLVHLSFPWHLQSAVLHLRASRKKGSLIRRRIRCVSGLMRQNFILWATSMIGFCRPDRPLIRPSGLPIFQPACCFLGTCSRLCCICRRLLRIRRQHICSCNCCLDLWRTEDLSQGHHWEEAMGEATRTNGILKHLG